MAIVQALVMAAVLAVSFFGYMLLLDGAGIRRAFIPIWVFSAVACAVYFSALLGMLLPGSIAVLAGGLVAFALRIRKRTFRPALTFFGVFFAGGTLLFFALLLLSRLTHYDNFSHWGIVVKEMLSTNAAPTAASALIDFKNYPLGISVFVYYVCRFVGPQQPVMIAAQGLLIFASFLAMFGIIAEKKRFLLYAFLGMGLASLSLFNLTIRISNLLVDFLLPILTLSIFAAAHWHRADARRACLSALPMAALLCITKSTGVVFAAIGLFYLAYTVLKTAGGKGRRQSLLLLCGTALLALLPLLLWSLHMSLAFRGVSNKFDLQGVGAAATAEQMRAIAALFLRTATDLTTRPALGILLLNGIAVAAGLFAALVLKKRWHLLKALAALDAVLVLYYAGILALYLFSMPPEEALWLAGFERYASSIVILFAGGLVLCATIDIERAFPVRVADAPPGQAFSSAGGKHRYQQAVIACLAVAAMLLLSEFNGMYAIIRAYPGSLPHDVQAIVGDRWYKGGEMDTRRYLVYAPDTDAQVTNYYLQYVTRYFLYAPSVDGVCLFWEDNLENLLSGYDYLLIAQSDASSRYLLKKHYGISAREGLFKITKGEGGVVLTPEEKEAAI